MTRAFVGTTICYKWRRVLFAMFGLIVGVALVIDKGSSEFGVGYLVAVLLFFVVPVAVVFLAVATRWKLLIDFVLLPTLFGLLAFVVFNGFYWPSKIRFSFETSSGASASYHMVQFEHRVGDRWIEGPTVEGRPMSVAFPDLNSDGYSDIRVVEANNHSGNAIEFVYVPGAKDGIYWQGCRLDSRLMAIYEPAGIFFNSP